MPWRAHIPLGSSSVCIASAVCALLIDSVDPIACTQYILHTLTPEGESVKQSKRYVANFCFFLATTGLDKLTSKVTHE